MRHKKAKEDYFGLHEVYYDENDNVMGYSENPLTGLFDSVEELIVSHRMMVEDAEKRKEKIIDFEGS
jgi:hypothetical protein